MTKSDVTLATGVVTATEPDDNHPGVTVSTATTSGAASAVIDAVAARMRADAGDVAATLAELDGQRVTLILHGSNRMGASMVIARPCTLFDGGQAYLPKGARKNGYGINTARVLGVVAGYDTDAAAELYARYDIGDWSPVTREALSELPNDPEARDCTLAVLTTTTIDHPVPGTVWLLYSYDPETDICDGMLVVPDDCNLESEYGSIYGADLVGRGALLGNTKPVSFAAAIEFDSTDEAFAAIGR